MQFVLKKVRLDNVSSRERQAAHREVKLLSKLNHPNVLGYVDSFMHKNYLCIVTEFCEGGDLYGKLKNARSYVNENQILDWFTQIVLAMHYVHKHRILHRDLKTQNVFLTKDNRVKLGDFGIARVLNAPVEMAVTVIGTPYYMSPEIMESRPYDFKSDVWSLGCVLYEMVSLKHAFDAQDMNGLVMKILRGKVMPAPPGYSQELKNLISQLLAKDPSQRPTTENILEMPLIKPRVDKFNASGSELNDGQDAQIRHARNILSLNPAEQQQPKGQNDRQRIRQEIERHRGDKQRIDDNLQRIQERRRVPKNAAAPPRNHRNVLNRDDPDAAAARHDRHARGARKPDAAIPQPAGAAPPARQQQHPAPAAEQPKVGCVHVARRRVRAGAGTPDHAEEKRPSPLEVGGGNVESLEKLQQRREQQQQQQALQGRGNGNQKGGERDKWPERKREEEPEPANPAEGVLQARQRRKEEEVRQREAQLSEARRRYFEEKKQAAERNRAQYQSAIDLPGADPAMRIEGNSRRQGNGVLEEEGEEEQENVRAQVERLKGHREAIDCKISHLEASLNKESPREDDGLHQVEEDMDWKREEGAGQGPVVRRETFTSGGAKERVAVLREVCESNLGKELFQKLYSYLRERERMLKNDEGVTDESTFRSELKERLGSERFKYVGLIDRLLLEEEDTRSHGSPS